MAGLRVTQLFAFVGKGADGDEGIIGVLMETPGGMPEWMPLIGADVDRVESLRDIALDVIAATPDLVSAELRVWAGPYRVIETLGTVEGEVSG